MLAPKTLVSLTVLMSFWPVARAGDLPPVPDTWLFSLDERDVGRKQKWYAPEFDDSGWKAIRIGQGWEEAGYEYDGTAWYRVRLSLPKPPEGKRLLLKFGAVDEEAWVWVNGKFAGQHAKGEGGWQEPFDIDLTAFVEPGKKNLIAVRVYDRMLQGGIWRPVTLALADPIPDEEKALAPQWPHWVKEEGFNANYLAWGPDEANAKKQLAAGCNVVLIKGQLAKPAYPADRNNAQVEIDEKSQLGLKVLQRWGKICRRNDAHFVALLDLFSQVEHKFMAAKHYTRAIAMDGKEQTTPAILDRVFWGMVTQQVLAIATMVPECEGVVLDTEMYAGPSVVYPWYARCPLNIDYADGSFAPFAVKKGLDPKLAPSKRYTTLRDRGLLADYQAHLFDQMRSVGERLIAAAHAVRPDFFVGIMNGDGWYIEGLLAGLGSKACPTVFMSEHEYAAPLAAGAKRSASQPERSATIVYCAGFLIAGWSPSHMASEAFDRMESADGYWIFCGNNLYDRRWKTRKGVWALVPGYTPDDYWRELGRVYTAWQQHRRTPSAPAVKWIGDLSTLASDAETKGVANRNGATVIRRTRSVPNLLRDGSFEQDWTKGGDSLWKNYYWPKRDDQVVHDGKWSIRVDANTKYANLKQKAPVEPGREYLLTVWQKHEDVLADPGYTIVGGRKRLRAAGTSDWHRVRQRIVAGEADKEKTIIFGLQSNFGKVWYDDAALRELESVELWTEPISLPDGMVWDCAEIEADIPFGADLYVDVFAARGETDEPLLRQFPVQAGKSVRPLAALSHCQPEASVLKLRLTVELGGPEDEEVVLRNVRVGVRQEAAIAPLTNKR